MRITTNMLMRNYQNSLSKSIGGLSDSRNAVLTGRRFTKASEDPSGALSASSLERKYVRNKSYLTTIKEVQSRQDAQEDAVMQMNKICQTIDRDYSVSAMSGTNMEQSIRKTYATAMRELQNSMVSSLNAQYGEEFVFGGAMGMKVPFELKEDGTLTYQGIDVNSTDPADQAKLKELSKESTFVDIGFGLSFETDASGKKSVVSSSAFDTSLPGINVIGYGDKNLITTIGKMADLLEAETFDKDAYSALWPDFREGATALTDVSTKLGTKTTLLESTQTRLTDLDLALSTQIDSIVNVDPAEALINYSWANYTYTTALKVGTNIISASLLDFIS